MKTLITILALLGVLFIIGCTESGSEPVTGAAVSEIQTQQNAEDSKAQTTQIIGAIVDVTIEDKSSEEEAIVSEITNKEAVEKQLGDAEHASSQQILKEICTPNALECYGNYVKKCKSDGSSWNNYYKYCSAGCENGVCEPTCTQGYLDEKRCSKNKIERKYQFSDCSTFWTYYYECEEECYEGRCIKKGPDIFFNLTPIENESSSASYGTGGGQEEGETDFYVTSILDGDTIELNTGDKVRLIGINAPETNQPCWEESASKLIELAYGKQVTLESDFEDKDQYGRLLRYVYVNKVFVNKELLRLGLANVQPYGSNTKYLQQLKQAEQEAKQTNGCLWQSSQEDPAKDKCLKVSNLKFNAAGDDCYNLNDEYVTFSNACNYIVDMTGWTAKDEANHIYIFPTFSLGANAKVTLYTGWGTDSSAQLYWRSSGYSCNAIWNNNGDTLFLRDRQGNLVIAYSYEGFS